MNKEEFFISECRFFLRLDIRLIALSKLLNEHENVLLATAGAKEKNIKEISKFHKELVSSLIKEDEEAVDYYTKYFEKLEKEQNEDIKTLSELVESIDNIYKELKKAVEKL